MLWDEVIIETALTCDEAAHALAQVFGVPPTHVRVVDEIDEAPLPEDVQILTELTPVGGEFSTRLTVYLRKEGLAVREREQVVSHLAERLGCRCLIDDGAESIYTWLLVDGNGRVAPVSIHPEGMDDDREDYFLVPSR